MLHTEFIPASDRTWRRLLIALHGLGDSIDGYRWLPDEMRIPWLNYLLVNAPDPYYGGFSWYDFSGDPRPGVERSRSLLFQLLDDQQHRGFATSDTVLFGFSQGCLMTTEVGFRYPHRFAGLVGVSGYVLDPAALLRQLSPVAREQRMLFTHGTQDPLIPCAQVRRQVAELQAAGLNIEWREFPKPHTIAGEAELGVIREFIRAGFAAKAHT
ncbi:MAG TPA: serine esterase [Methylomirabilota bacterium]|nr:serine esterase [Methylomirabilota bacterium]